MISFEIEICQSILPNYIITYGYPVLETSKPFLISFLVFIVVAAFGLHNITSCKRDKPEGERKTSKYLFSGLMASLLFICDHSFCQFSSVEVFATRK